MQCKQVVLIIRLAVVLLAFFALTGVVRAQEGQSAAELIAMNGQVEVKARGGSFRAAQLKDSLQVGDTIRTLENSKAKILFQDESVTVLGEKTTLEISQYHFNATTKQRLGLLKTLEGKIRFTIQKIAGAPQPDMSIETEVLSVGIRGTDGILEAGQPNRVYLLEAAKPLLLKNKSTGETLDLPPGQYVVAEKFKPMQMSPITPAMYQRLKKEFRVSYTFEPQNLMNPVAPESSYRLAGPGETPAQPLPPVVQAPLPTLHQPPSGQHPHPPVQPPYVPPVQPPYVPPVTPPYVPGPTGGGQY